MMMSKKWKTLSVILPVGLCVVFVVLLQMQVIQNLFHLKLIQLPLPSDVGKTILDGRVRIAKDCAMTLKSVFPGMILGAVLGIALAGLATALPNVGYGGLIILTAINSIPVLALAPLMERWFPSDVSAKTAVVTIVCMGGIAVNAFKGFNTLPQYSLDMMKTYACSKWQTFYKLRLPNSVPYVFTSLKTNVATGMMAAIISEYYAKETSGLGYMIKNSLKVGNHKVRGWAYILVTAVISILIYAVICFIEKKVMAKRNGHS